jgi:hypothetical protein
VLDEYSAGNHQGCSQTVIPLDSRHCVPLSTLREWAKETALDDAETYGLSELDVFEDEDLSKSLKEEFEYLHRQLAQEGL